MIAFFDVDYKDDQANVACVLAEHWQDASPFRVYKKIIHEVAAYESGAFYKRELPCLLSVITDIVEKIEYYVVDGYVWLGEKPGLGHHLFEGTGAQIPVIGVAKTRFHNNFKAIEVFRGQSKNPLYVTSVGVETMECGRFIEQMDGSSRLPTLLKLTDSLCRSW